MCYLFVLSTLDTLVFCQVLALSANLDYAKGIACMLDVKIKLNYEKMEFEVK